MNGKLRCDCGIHRGIGDAVQCRNLRLSRLGESACSCQCHRPQPSDDEPRVPVVNGIKTTGYTAGTAKPCPFCGGTNIYVTHEDGEYDDKSVPPRPTWAVYCGSCAAQGPWRKSGASSPLFDWNMRDGKRELM